MSPFNLGIKTNLCCDKQMLDRQLKDFTLLKLQAEALAERDRALNLQRFNDQMRLMDLQDLDRELTTQIERARELQKMSIKCRFQFKKSKEDDDVLLQEMGIQVKRGWNGYAHGEQPPMPMPEQPPMPTGEQLDPNIVQQALTQAAGGIGDLDQVQNYEQVSNTMCDQATVEQRRQN